MGVMVRAMLSGFSIAVTLAACSGGQTGGPPTSNLNSPTPAASATAAGVPTATSSAPPSVAPTTGPSVAPTVAPSIVPTTALSAAPTLAPTIAPTIGPTIAPTIAPTAAPTPAGGLGVGAVPSSCCDGVFTTATIQGHTVWQTHSGAPYIYFAIPAALHASPGQPIYAAVQYYDSGHSRLSYDYDGTGSPYTSADATAHSSLVDSGAFATSYFAMLTPSLQHRENGGTDFRLADGGAPTSFASVTLSKQPFPDATFQMALTRPKPWLSAVTTRQPGADPATLKGSVMVGYQGWFRCPNDLDDAGRWVHWVRNGSFAPQNLTTDMWPDMSSYPQASRCRADTLSLQSGQPAYVFSSADPNVVEQHFSWMQQNNIDGVFLQRFVSTRPAGSDPEWVLANVRRAAADHGRIWTIEYDLSGRTDADLLPLVENDWKFLVTSGHIREDASYAHENAKPVVVLWGCSIRSLSPASCDALVDWFKNDPAYGGNYVIGGISNVWQTLPAWQEHFTHYNGILVWQTHSFAQDQTYFGGLGLDYYADVLPGFSWSNLKLSNYGFIDRSGGQFYWNKMYDAVQGGSKRMFVGMFDEYDEGTAIMPMSDDAPLTQPYGHFINNEGRPSTWWLQLTADGKAMMNGLRPLTPTMP